MDSPPIPNARLWQRQEFWKNIKQRKLLSLFEKKEIIFVDPENTYIEKGVKIGRGTRFEPGTYLYGTKTIIGANCKIGPLVVITDSWLGNDIAVGPLAVLKRCTILSGTKIPHECYLGDARIGNEVNIGAGTKTSNMDGFEKNKTEIGSRCFIGTFVDFIAPITIGEECFVASRTKISSKTVIPSHSFVSEETSPNGRTRIVVKTNCSFKLPGHWKWLWTQKPINPILMQELFDVLQSRFEDYAQWLNAPQAELAGDKPRNFIKKRGEEGVKKVKSLAEGAPPLNLIPV